MQRLRRARLQIRESCRALSDPGTVRATFSTWASGSRGTMRYCVDFNAKNCKLPSRCAQGGPCISYNRIPLRGNLKKEKMYDCFVTFPGHRYNGLNHFSGDRSSCRRVLLDQWARALAVCWPYPIGRLGDGDHQVLPVTVATYASAVAWAPRVGDQFGLVIVDEAHHVGAWCPSELLEMLPAAARMGLTATPPADTRVLERSVGRVVYGLSIDDLSGDALAPYELRTVPISLTPDERARYRALRSRFAVVYARIARATGSGSWNFFVRAASRSAEGQQALDAWRAYRALLAYPEGKRASLRELLARHAGERTLVFTSDNATAYAIARELLVMPVTCEIGRTERARVLGRFRDGEISVLVSAQVLDEGVDVPDADVAIIVGGTASARRHVQRIGRVLRPRAGKRAIVYELAVGESAETSYVQRRRAGLEPTDDRQVPGVFASGSVP